MKKKLQCFFYSVSIGNQLYKMFKENSILAKNKHLPKKMVYNSDNVKNIQITIDVLYDIFNTNQKRHYKYLVLLETIRLFFRTYEMKNMISYGFPIYISKDSFFNHVVYMDENDYMQNLSLASKSNMHLSVKPKKSFVYIPVPKDSKIEMFEGFSENSFDCQEEKGRYSFSFKNLGEIFFLLKPVIYITLYVKFKDKPVISFIISVLFDLISFCFNLLSKNTVFSIKSIFNYEMSFRKGKLFLYVLREPFYTKVTEKLLKKIFRFLPLPNFILTFIMELIYYYKHVSFLT